MRGRDLTESSFRGALNNQAGEDWWFTIAGSRSATFFKRTFVIVDQIKSGDLVQSSVDKIYKLDINFDLFEGTLLLRVDSPGRTVRPLMDALQSVFGYGFSVEPIIIKVGVEDIGSVFDAVRMVGLKITNVILPDGSVGRMEFASRSGISINNIEFLADLKYSIDFVKYEVFYRGLSGSLSVYSTGLLKWNGSVSEVVSSFVASHVQKVAIAGSGSKVSRPSHGASTI